ncbi:MAG: sensor histidine kinase [Paracoccus sp. (in: a-proteobacteria)]|uniref:sensor histidine kinase n=1 Tax=Paracoccus sp. TaxID=267 RepID=UPI0040582B08
MAGSIRWRLQVLSAIGIAALLAAFAAGLVILFDRQVTRLAVNELEHRAAALVAGLDRADPTRAPAPAIGGNPRYLQPYSGLYWQIEVAGQIYRSASLWDANLALPKAAPAMGETAQYELPGPDDQRLLVLERGLSIGMPPVPLRVTVAESRASLDEAEAQFGRDMLPFLLALGALMLVGVAAQVTVGLRPFARVRQQIAAVQTGARPRLGPGQPSEVRPLAQAIDALLDDRDDRIARARTRAVDLAHTLKTPLQALMGEAGRLRAAGHAGAAEAIEDITATVRDRVDAELARARIGSGRRADVADAARKVARVLARTARAEKIDLALDIAPGLQVAIDESDLIEALGSIAENAQRHARSRVMLEATREGDEVALRVSDNGPGVPEAVLSRLTARGVSADPEPGSDGIGLSLAETVLRAHGGRLRLRNLSRGGAVIGFEVTMHLPAPVLAT